MIQLINERKFDIHNKIEEINFINDEFYFLSQKINQIEEEIELQKIEFIDLKQKIKINENIFLSSYKSFSENISINESKVYIFIIKERRRFTFIKFKYLQKK